MTIRPANGQTVPAVTSVDKVSEGLLIHFADGESYFFDEAALYQFRLRHGKQVFGDAGPS